MTDYILVKRETLQAAADCPPSEYERMYAIKKELQALLAAPCEPVGYIDECDKPRLSTDQRLLELSRSGGCQLLYTQKDAS